MGNVDARAKRCCSPAPARRGQPGRQGEGERACRLRAAQSLEAIDAAASTQRPTFKEEQSRATESSAVVVAGQLVQCFSGRSRSRSGATGPTFGSSCAGAKPRPGKKRRGFSLASDRPRMVARTGQRGFGSTCSKSSAWARHDGRATHTRRDPPCPLPPFWSIGA